ncbi:MAG: hypothetical protein WC916_00370 [Candidatus Woesearchaeota archaeon]
MKSYSIILVLVLIFASTNILAWTSDTHEWICNHAGLPDLDCKNADYPAVQKNYSGLGFVNHHCANNAIDCAARRTAVKFKAMNTTITDGFAAHLYADSLVPVHWYSLDYYSCHKIFEDRVEYELQHAGTTVYAIFGDIIDTTKWSFTMECTDKKDVSHKLAASNEYMNGVVERVAEKMGSTPTTPSINTVNLTAPVIIIVLVVIVLVILILFGRKTAKRKLS